MKMEGAEVILFLRSEKACNIHLDWEKREENSEIYNCQAEQSMQLRLMVMNLSKINQYGCLIFCNGFYCSGAGTV